MRPKLYPYEPGEVWETRIGIRYEIIWLDGKYAEVEKKPHPAFPGGKGCLAPVRKTVRISDFDHIVIKNVTEGIAA